MSHEFDLIVIGSGPAGGSAASAAARTGRRVAMIERDARGGTCLNYGCDPTKTLLHTAQLLYRARHASELGLHIPSVTADWSQVLAHVGQVQQTLRGGSPSQARASLAASGIDVVMGEAQFRSPHEVEVNGQTLRAKRIVIAVGTVPFIPDIPGLPEAGYITNIEAVSLPELPERMAIIGGGPIGLEFAQLFQRFGVAVTVIEQGTQFLPREEPELATELCSLLAEEGVEARLCSEVRCSGVDGRGKHLQLQHDTGKEEVLVTDEILVAVGRRPALDGLNLAAAGVDHTDEGIPTDATLRTNVPHIWAAGDITSEYQLTLVADDQGALVAHNAFADEPLSFDDRVIPWVTFTDPELARVGRTESELQAAGIEYRVGRASFDKSDRAIATHQPVGSMKLLAAADGKLLGGHILGPQAGELIGLLVYAMRFDLTVKQLGEAMLPYPTLAAVVRWAAGEM
jgi:pyruvate/2-oxoglutarate dehydrogenase complex dihydrolipoamide dehydrogenase (E3) component